MDPNATLERLRGLSREVAREVDNDSGDLDLRLAEFADLFDALDEWKSRGGFDPEAWQ